MPKIYALKEEEKLPNEFWVDQRWALEHYSEFRKEYADMWIAILNQKIVASGEGLTEEKEEFLRKNAGRPLVILFVESEARILSMAPPLGVKGGIEKWKEKHIIPTKTT